MKNPRLKSPKRVSIRKVTRYTVVKNSAGVPSITRTVLRLDTFKDGSTYYFDGKRIVTEEHYATRINAASEIITEAINAVRMYGGLLNNAQKHLDYAKKLYKDIAKKKTGKK